PTQARELTDQDEVSRLDLLQQPVHAPPHSRAAGRGVGLDEGLHGQSMPMGIVQNRQTLALEPLASRRDPYVGHGVHGPCSWCRRKGPLAILPTATLECIAKIFPCRMAVLQGPVTSVMSV